MEYTIDELRSIRIIALSGVILDSDCAFNLLRCEAVFTLRILNLTFLGITSNCLFSYMVDVLKEVLYA